METISTKALKNGKFRTTVDINPGEKLIAVNEDRFYQLGGSVDDVHRGHVLTETKEVYWCGITQEWERS